MTPAIALHYERSGFSTPISQNIAPRDSTLGGDAILLLWNVQHFLPPGSNHALRSSPVGDRPLFLFFAEPIAIGDGVWVAAYRWLGFDDVQPFLILLGAATFAVIGGAGRGCG